MSATVGFAQRVSTGGLLCENSVFSVTLWCVLARKSSTTETQRTQRLHREDLDRDFLCKAATVTAFRCAFCLLALFFIVANVSAKTVYVDLLAANQNSDSVVAFSRDAKSGKLTPAGQVLDVPSPVCIQFVRK